MRVLTVGNMYPPHALGGYEVTWRSAVAEMRRAGHEVRVITTDFSLPGAGPEDDPDVHRELRWYWEDHDFPRRSLRERLAIERGNARILRRHLGEFSPDVVNWWAMGGMSLAMIELVHRAGLPAVGVVGDDWMVYGPQVDAWQRLASRAGPLRAPLGRIAGVPSGVDLGAAATWLFNSESTRASAVAAAGPLPAAEVAHPGVDLELLAPAPAQEWRWRLLCLGRLDRRKGIHVAIASLRHLPEARLAIVGAGDAEYESELRAQAQRDGLAERVSFGHVDRDGLRAAYADADALVFPALWEEPWGLVPLEAMAVGTPVVATGTGGSREYLRDGVNCLIYRPRDDPEALASSIRRLAGDEELRSRLRQDGIETASRYPSSAYDEAIRNELERVAAAGRI